MSGSTPAVKAVDQRRCFGSATLLVALQEFHRLAEDRGQPYIGLRNAPRSGVSMELLEDSDGKLYLAFNGFQS